MAALAKPGLAIAVFVTLLLVTLGLLWTAGWLLKRIFRCGETLPEPRRPYVHPVVIAFAAQANPALVHPESRKAA